MTPCARAIGSGKALVRVVRARLYVSVVLLRARLIFGDLKMLKKSESRRGL